MTHPFTGTITFDAQLKLLGTTVKRRMRAIYGYTPEWPFIDPETGTEKTDDEAISVGLEVFAKPRTEGMLGLKAAQRQPYWAEVNNLLKVGVLNRRVYERIDARIDAEARAQDLERRQKPDPTKPPLPNSL